MSGQQQKLKIAIAGLGRMGARHAHHFYALTPRADLVAVSSPEAHELSAAEKNLPGVRTYLDYDDMLEAECARGLQAVVIASATAVHSEQAIKAIQRGLHVLCEKPLSTGVEKVCAITTTATTTATELIFPPLPQSHCLGREIDGWCCSTPAPWQ